MRLLEKEKVGDSDKNHSRYHHQHPATASDASTRGHKDDLLRQRASRGRQMNVRTHQKGQDIRNNKHVEDVPPAVWCDQGRQ